MQHAVIMAGGSGTRLWPLSRRGRPKQLLRLFEGKSLLRHAFERLADIVPPGQIHVITLAAHLEQVRGELPEVPESNLFGEPCGRDTCNAIGLSASILQRRDPAAMMGIFTADHLITPADRFRAAIERAFSLVDREPDALVTFGIPPAFPHTGYGYVRRGTKLADDAWTVEAFVEKPDAASAARMLADGGYYWNSGMFIWRAETILAEMRRLVPEQYECFARMAEAWDTPQGAEVARRLYPTLPRISVDYAVMEKARGVKVVEMDCRWLDVGSWAALADVLPADEGGNVSAAERVVHLGSKRMIVVSEDPNHLVATAGVEDLIVVHSPDATLVCRKQDAQAVRELLKQVQARFGPQYD